MHHILLFLIENVRRLVFGIHHAKHVCALLLLDYVATHLLISEKVRLLARWIATCILPRRHSRVLA